MSIGVVAAGFVSGANYAGEVLAESTLKAWYRLGDAVAATVMTDSSGNARNGGYAGGAALPTLGVPGFITGDVNTAASFDGGDRASIIDAAWMDGTTIALEAWVKQSDLTGNQQILYRDNTNFSGANMRYWHLRIASGVPVFTFWASDGGVQQNVIATTTLIVGVKYQIVGTYDGTTGRIFVNGIQEATVSISGSIQSSATGASIQVGSNGASEFFKGTLDELAIYSALPADRVYAHYLAGNSGLQVTEHGHASNSGFLVGSIGITFSTTPLSGDVIVVRVWNLRDSVTCTSITGLTGAIWTKVANTPDTDQDLQVWVGTGATASGTITVNFNGGAQADCMAYIARGLPSVAPAFTAGDLNTIGVVAGPSRDAAVGQHVLTLGYSNKLTAFSGTTPGSDWDNDALISIPGDANTKLGHSTRNPTGASASHQASGTNSDSASGRHLVVTLR